MNHNNTLYNICRKTVHGVFYKNPLFVNLLGITPVIAAADSLSQGLILCLFSSLSFFPVFLLSYLFKNSKSFLLIPVYFIVSSALLWLLTALTGSLFPIPETGFKLFIPLLAVNSVSFLSGEDMRGQKNIKTAFFTFFVKAAGYSFAVILVAGIREILSGGKILTVLIFKTPLQNNFVNEPFFIFLILSVLAALLQWVRLAAGKQKERTKEEN